MHLTLRCGLVLGLGLVLCVAACSSARQSVREHPTTTRAEQTPPVPARFTVHEIAPKTFVFHEPEPWASNVLLAEMSVGTLVLVNAPATESSTHALLDYIRARFGQRRLVVINSHHHVDSVGGNALLLEHGAEVIASTQTAELIARDTSGQVRGAATDGLIPAALAADFLATRIEPPSRTFAPADGLTLRFGAEEVHVLYPGPAHSVDNVVIHFPARRVLFGGCMVRSGDTLGPTDHADLTHWPTAIATLQALAPMLVVPGHGARFDADQLQHTLDLLAATRP